MNIYDTLYMLAAVEELAPEPTFFKRRYFPTDMDLDVFGTSKVLADYKEGNRKAAPFVIPRVGPLPVGRGGFSTYELEPGNISISKPLTIDQLTKRGFGESIMSTATPEIRARRLLMSDLSDLSARITRTEEWLACATMLDNGCIMRHQTDDPEIYEDVPVKFYDGDNNPAQFTPGAAWAHGKDEHTPGNWYHDIIQMIHTREPEALKKFCKGIQFGAPVDSYVTPEPWDMPGYDCPVIMAAGAFIQGASIELSADAPMRPPYTVYLQGGLTFESGKLGVLLAVEELLRA